MPSDLQEDVEDIVQNGYMGVLEIISHLQNLATVPHSELNKQKGADREKQMGLAQNYGTNDPQK